MKDIKKYFHQIIRHGQKLITRMVIVDFIQHVRNIPYEAIDKYGIIKGSYKLVHRIIRCNPWSKGGFDPVK